MSVDPPGRSRHAPDADRDVSGLREVARLASAIGEAAGALLLDYFRRESLASELKADHSLVTEADVAADHLIADELRRHFPGEGIVSEELKPSHTRGSECTWIVDPLDGTGNFSQGLHHWGVSIARCDAAGPQVGVLVFPALGETYVAWRGGGATLGGRPLRVRVPRPPADTAILACCSRTPRWHHVNLPMKIRVFGAATWSLACVARGSAAICYETRAKVWDLAAGWCVVEEAGGVVEAIGGRRPFPLDASVDFATMDFPVLAAASPGLAAQAREHIEPR